MHSRTCSFPTALPPKQNLQAAAKSISQLHQPVSIYVENVTMIITLLKIPHGMRDGISVFQSCTVIAHSSPPGPAWITGCFLSDLPSFIKSHIAKHGFQMKVPLYWKEKSLYIVSFPRETRGICCCFLFWFGFFW